MVGKSKLSCGSILPILAKRTSFLRLREHMIELLPLKTFKEAFVEQD